MAPVELVDVPQAYLGCVVLGLGLTALAWWKKPPESLRAFVLILGQTIVLTMPLAWYLDTYVYGAFPTIDKEGSLLFYLDRVHLRMLLHPWLSTGDPAAHLIGVHTGHLWLTQLFDLFLSPHGAFNAQALLYPALAWWSSWLLLREVGGNSRIAFVLAFGWGMGLHLFRDLNWYTIEKAAIFWLALYCWALLKAWAQVPSAPVDRAGEPGGAIPEGRLRQTGPWPWISALLFGLMAWNNLYLGLVGAVIGAMAFASTLASALWLWRRGDHSAYARAAARFRNVGLACVAATLAASPLLLLQLLLLHGGPSLGDPERFLYERAALDSFTLIPLRWNRLETWRALNMVVVGLALFGGWFRRRDPRVRFAVLTGTVLAVLSLGPFVLPGVENPLYMLLRAVVPGWWRIAKPEVFFHGTWLLMCAVAALQLARVVERPRTLGGLYLLFVIGWVIMVRTHPAYPEMTMPVRTELKAGWEEQVFQ